MLNSLRHAYARERYQERMDGGMEQKQARTEVAELLGHGRDDVTRVYLRRKYLIGVPQLVLLSCLDGLFQILVGELHIEQTTLLEKLIQQIDVSVAKHN